MNSHAIYTKLALGTTLALQLSHIETAAAYHAAGVLPYAIDANNKAWLLLGSEDIKSGQVSDFGGGKDYDDKDDSAVTAAREGCEELLFMFDEETKTFPALLKSKLSHCFDFNASATYKLLLHDIKHNKTSYNSTFNGYVTHFVKIPYNTHLPTDFHARKKKYSSKLPFCWNEKVSLYWVPLEEILIAIAKSKDLNSVYINTPHGYVQLFAPFVESILAAKKNKIPLFS
jgi:hypothetical protein